jgi:hypothetical protein
MQIIWQLTVGVSSLQEREKILLHVHIEESGFTYHKQQVEKMLLDQLHKQQLEKEALENYIHCVRKFTFCYCCIWWHSIEGMQHLFLC